MGWLWQGFWQQKTSVKSFSLLLQVLWPLLLFSLWQAKLVMLGFFIAELAQVFLAKLLPATRSLSLRSLLMLPVFVYVLRNTMLVDLAAEQIVWLYAWILWQVVRLGSETVAIRKHLRQRRDG